jgi:hypothetical protein
MSEEDAALYAEWVNQHTGYQTVVVPASRFGSAYVIVTDDRGARYRLTTRAEIARFVNSQSDSR